MDIIHFLTWLRYKMKYEAKVEFKEDRLEELIQKYYRIPCLTKGLQQRKKGRRIIVSLTTVPSRIDKVWMTIESLLRQKEKPDRILLWLAEDEFRDIPIPQTLKMQEKWGLEIRYCNNLRSYKKFYYSMLEFPDDYVLTVDDDSIYSERMIREMLIVSELYPNCVISNRSHWIHSDGQHLFEYLRWHSYDDRRNISGVPSYHNFFTGNGGVLFPVRLLDKAIFDQNAFLEIAPTADDAWLNFAAWKSKVKVVNTTGILGFVLPIHSICYQGLCIENSARKEGNWECKNDIQIRKVLEYFEIDIAKYF